MTVQTDSTNQNAPFITSGNSFTKTGTISQDAQRAADLLQFTVMAYDADNEEWVPFNTLGQLHGISVPQGIYLGDDIAAADLVAGDIDDCPILIGGCCTVDTEAVVWDQDLLNAATEIGILLTAEACLRSFGIFLEDTEAISAAGL